MSSQAVITVSAKQYELVEAVLSSQGKSISGWANNTLPPAAIDETCGFIANAIKSGINKGDVLIEAGLNRFARISDDSNEPGYQINFEDFAGNPLDGGGLIENDDPSEIAYAVFHWTDD